MSNNIKQTNRKKLIKIIAILAIFLAISVLLSFLEFPVPIPIWPSYLEMDFSIILVVVTLFIFGFEYAILLSFLKNLFKFVIDPSLGSWVGPLLNFLLAIVFILSIIIVFKMIARFLKKILWLLIISIIISIILVSFMSVLLNYGFILRLYGINPHELGFTTIFITYFSFTCFKFSINSILILIILISLKPLIHTYSDYIEQVKNQYLLKINPKIY